MIFLTHFKLSQITSNVLSRSYYPATNSCSKKVILTLITASGFFQPRKMTRDRRSSKQWEKSQPSECDRSCSRAAMSRSQLNSTINSIWQFLHCKYREFRFPSRRCPQNLRYVCKENLWNGKDKTGEEEMCVAAITKRNAIITI